MREVRDFDNYVRSELNDLSSTVSPHIWENIVAARGKRKPVGFWSNFLNTKNVLVAAGVLVVITGSYFLLNNAGDNETIENKNIATTVVSSQDEKIISENKNEINDQSTQNNVDVITNATAPTNSFNADNNITQEKAENRMIKQNKIAFINNNNAQEIDEDITITEVDNTTGKYLPSITASIQNNLLGRLKMQPQPVFAATPSEAFLRSRQFPNVTLPGCPTVEEQAAGNKKYIEIYAGPDFTLRNFKDTSVSSVYLERRKASTKVSSAYSAGVRYTRVFKNGMSMKVGLNYSQVNEKFSFIQSNLSQVTYIIDPVTGDTTGSYTVSGTRKKTTYNKYRTIDIPLLIGYELGNGRLHVNINMGAMINLYSWQKGEVLDTLLQPVTITTGKSSSSLYQFKSNVGLGLTGGVGVYYKLTDRLHIMAEPYFRYNLQPMSQSSLTLQQKYNTIGMHAGIRLDLE